MASVDKVKSGKTSKNEKVMKKNHNSCEKEDKDGDKQIKENRDEEQKKSKKRKKKYFWEAMTDKREEERFEVPSDHRWEKVQVIMKIIVCIFISIFVLATAVISRLCLILITSNLLPPMNDTDSYWWHKTAGYSFRYIDHETNVQWIWALMLIMSAPYMFTVLRSGWQLWIGKKKWESGWEGFWKAILLETLHSIGLCMMAFVLLPSIDPIAGILVCFNVATIPGCLGIRQSFFDQSNTRFEKVLFTVAVFLQLVGIALACTYYFLENQTETRIVQGITICLSPLLTSCSWWENYVHFTKKSKIVPKDSSKDPRVVRTDANSDVEKQEHAPKTGVDLLECRSEKVNVLVNLWKVTIALLVPIFLFGLSLSDVSKSMGTLFGLSPNSIFANGFGKSVLSSKTCFGHCNNYLPLIVAVVGIICSGACYSAVHIGCKILAQIICVSIPLTISSPIALAALFGILSRDTNTQYYFLSFPLWNTHASKLLSHIWSSNYGMIIASGICGYISLGIISYHIWIPDIKRLRKSEELFAKPLYCGILTDQSIPLNFKRTGTVKEKIPSSTIPQLYICATMWQEDKSEMTQLMKSIFNLDEENSLTREMNKDTAQGVFNEDIFDFEVHILFDNAFKYETQEDHQGNGTKESETQNDHLSKGKYILNEYVKNLIEVVREVSGNKLLPLAKSTTDYGGRLQWILPKGSVMYAHLKNNNLIRCKKRWSQVMYMYFLLGYQFLKKIPRKQRKEIKDISTTLANNPGLKKKMKNTFIMALDGDVDFKPEAINYLMDRMKTHPKAGAACGRIHPTGNGPVVMYQKFEYAVSHWLHKATEDMLGCVLCSPGCFSLYRGLALIDPHVMSVYSKIPEKGQDHIQYDQGEDRWLCTLILQQGYKIEYVAASDAFTNAPEQFNEFFKQRRRWTPSTMANILDLIISWKHVVKTNPYISVIYMCYQSFLMFSTLLTPGTILLMIVEAITMAFPPLPLWVALMLTLLPVAAFVVICFNATSEIQLKYAAILSIVYALVMTIVLVGLVVQVVQYGLCSITTIFFIYVATVFVTTAILHPKEFSCVLHGFLYFIAIPCTSLIMMIYALCNLNEISWGTRETTQKQDTRHGSKDNQSVSLHTSHGTGSLLRCLCCSQETGAEKANRNKETATVVDNATQIFYEEGSETRSSDQEKDDEESNNNSNPPNIQQNSQEEKKHSNEIKEWMDYKRLEKTKVESIRVSETHFWKRTIRHYLQPFDHKDEDKERVELKLKNLRNKVCLFILMINALFICIFFSLQQMTVDSKIMSIPIPCVTGQNRPNYVEPISLLFTFIFGIILTAQFLCMLLHRLGTLIHVCYRTEIFANDFKHNMKKLKADVLVAHRLELWKDYVLRQIQRRYSITDSESDSETLAKKKWKGATETVIKQIRMDPWKQVTKYVDELVNARSKGVDKKKEMQQIAEKFPNFSNQSHRAIHQFICYKYDAQQRNTSVTVSSN